SAGTSQAIDLARDGKVVTLIITADATWGDVKPVRKTVASPPEPGSRERDASSFARAISALEHHGNDALILLGDTALLGDSAQWATGLAQRFGCRVAARSLSARMDRGGERPAIDRIPFEIDAALAYLENVKCLVTIGAPAPV